MTTRDGPVSEALKAEGFVRIRAWVTRELAERIEDEMARHQSRMEWIRQNARNDDRAQDTCGLGDIK
jgi:hypothetical protein